MPMVVDVVSVRADDFFGTSGRDTIDGTDEDDDIFGKEGNDDLDGKGGDNYIEGNEGNDEITDGSGSGRDKVELEGTGEEEDDAGGVDEAHGGKGKDVIDATNNADFLLIYGGPDDDTLSAEGEGGGRI